MPSFWDFRIFGRIQLGVRQSVRWVIRRFRLYEALLDAWLTWSILCRARSDCPTVRLKITFCWLFFNSKQCMQGNLIQITLEITTVCNWQRTPFPVFLVSNCNSLYDGSSFTLSAFGRVCGITVALNILYYSPQTLPYKPFICAVGQQINLSANVIPNIPVTFLFKVRWDGNNETVMNWTTASSFTCTQLGYHSLSAAAENDVSVVTIRCGGALHGEGFFFRMPRGIEFTMKKRVDCMFELFICLYLVRHLIFRRPILTVKFDDLVIFFPLLQLCHWR